MDSKPATSLNCPAELAEMSNNAPFASEDPLILLRWQEFFIVTIKVVEPSPVVAVVVVGRKPLFAA